MPADNAAISCDGSRVCAAELHLHGCYADDGSNCDHPSEHEQPAAYVRVRDSAVSEFRGQVLRVIHVEHQAAGRVTYLCEMPGWPYSGWFRDNEVEDA